MSAGHRAGPNVRPVAPNLGEGERGLSLVEIAIALLVVAVASAGLYAYLAQTKKTLEAVHSGQVVGHVRLTADLATLAAIRNQLDLYYASHGQWPASKEASVGALATPPRFQCPGNDYTFDPSSGAITLLIMDPSRC
jgi:prepilin-type N-terminal cleavage/methylation domain-containing protein